MANRFLAVIALILALSSLIAAQGQSTTYGETRKLLRGVETSPANGKLRKLFRTGDQLLPDLVEALDDSDSKVSASAQRLLYYLAIPEGLKAVSEWCLRIHGNCPSPLLGVLPRELVMSGTSDDPLSIANQNKKLFKGAAFNSGDIHFRKLAVNKNANVVLLEVVQGQVLTAGWHAVIRKKNGQWYLVSDNNIWVT